MTKLFPSLPSYPPQEKKSQSSSKALPTQGYNLSENDKVIFRLTTVRARPITKWQSYLHTKNRKVLQKHHLPKDIICLKMTKLFASLPQSELGPTIKWQSSLQPNITQAWHLSATKITKSFTSISHPRLKSVWRWVICKLTTVRDRTYLKMTKFFAA